MTYADWEQRELDQVDPDELDVFARIRPTHWPWSENHPDNEEDDS